MAKYWSIGVVELNPRSCKSTEHAIVKVGYGYISLGLIMLNRTIIYLAQG